MKKICFLFLTLFSFSIKAEGIKIETDPMKPLAGEPFQLIFKVSTDADETPEITFTPQKLEVLGKQNQGLSTRTVYSQGKIQVTREFIISYEVVASSSGTSGLREIQADIGGKILTHPSYNITILKEAEVSADVFMRAEADKTQLYIGEGTVVRYFIYSKAPLNNLEVKKYPELNSFMKRFLQETDQAERVAVDGEIYLRRQIYSARLFPERVGKLKVDPLVLSVTYTTIANSGMYGFGFGPRELKTKTISSDNVDINVVDVPAEGKPDSFTGLVGPHEFKLSVNQEKVLVNEPLIFKLTAEGPGALEKFEATPVLTDTSFEEFETQGDLKLIDAYKGIKTFEFTYLPKKPIKLDSTSYPLSYFDSQTRKYVTVKLTIPTVTIGGKADESRPAEQPVVAKKEPKTSEEKPSSTPNLSEKEISFLPESGLSFSFLSLLTLLIFTGWSFYPLVQEWVLKNKKFREEARVMSKDDLKSLIELLRPLMTKTGKSPGQIIAESPLDEQSKSRMLNLLNELNQKEYGRAKGKDVVLDKESLRLFKKYIKGEVNAYTTQSRRSFKA